MSKPSMPNAATAEASLLGGMIRDPKQIPDIASTVKPRDFYRPEHERLFHLLCRLYQDKKTIDQVTLPEYIAQTGASDMYGGVTYVLEISDSVPSTANLDSYASMVIRAAQYRRSIEALSEAQDACYHTMDDPSAIIEKVTSDLAKISSFGDSQEEPQHFSDVILDVLDQKEIRLQRGISSGVSTGIKSVDDWLGANGMRRKDLIILAARPSMGKSALAIQCWLNVGARGEPSGLTSIEMSKELVVNRALAAYTGIPLGIIQDETVWTQRDWDDVYAARDEMQKMPLLLWSPRRPTVAQIRSTALRWQMRHGKLGFLAVDYLTRIQHDGRDRNTSLGENAQELKELAEECDCPLMLLHAVNRQAESAASRDNVPTMAHLKDSGDIEYHADVVAFVHRPAYYDQRQAKDVAQLVIAKNRQGQCGTAEMRWHGAIQRFTDMGEK